MSVNQHAVDTAKKSLLKFYPIILLIVFSTAIVFAQKHTKAIAKVNSDQNEMTEQMTLKTAALPAKHPAASSLTASLRSDPLHVDADNKSTIATQATLVAGPGGVAAPAVWLKADAGTSTTTNGSPVITWSDQSPSAFSFAADYRNGADNPTFVSSGINFNPAMNYERGAMHTIPVGTGPLLVNSTVFFAGKMNSIDYDGYRSMWTSASSLGGDRTWAPYLGFNQMGKYDLGTSEDYTSLRWDMNEVSFNRSKMTSDFKIVYSKLGSGEQTVNNLIDAGNASNRYFALGNNPDNTSWEPFGQVAETIIYNTSSMSATDIQKVESYLALKYGVTLDQTSPQNYLASDGTTISWNAAAAATGFNHNIFGIGQDAGGGLDQRVAQSSNTGSVLTLSTTNNFTAANPDAARVSLSDLNFATIADNTGTPTWDGSKGTNGYYKLLDREWQVQTAGTPGILHLQFDVDNSTFDIPALLGGDVYYIVTDPDGNGDYSDGSVTALNNAGTGLWHIAINLQSGAKFTLATTVSNVGPGGVSANLALWLKTNAGTDATANMSPSGNWTDQSGVELPAAGSPLYVVDALNYQPAISYGSVNYHYLDSKTIPVSNSTVFIAGTPLYNNTDDGWYAPWTADNEADYPLILFDNYIGHYGNYDYYPLPWSFGTPGFAREHVYSNSDVAVSKQGSAVVLNPGQAAGSGNYYFLGSNGYGEGFGQLAETIIFNDATSLSATDINKIESYLALKYGLAKDMNDGNYTLSNGGTAWTADATYQTAVIGIVRDDVSGLTQKQSHTTDDSVRLFVGNLSADNISNSGHISNNLSSVMIGNNAGAIKTNTTTPKPVSITKISGRTWKITKTNFTDPFSVELAWDAADVIDITKARLLVSGTPDFSTATVYDNTSGLTFTQGSVIVGNITSQIPDGTSFFTIGFAPLTTLSVGITDFSVHAVNNSSVALDWQTSTEINSNYFGVERSADSRKWEELTKVNASGNSPAPVNYSTADKNPYNGISYYRIKENNVDGSYKYTAAHMVKIDKNKNSGIMVYPNPASNSVVIKADEAELTTLRIFDTFGLEVTGHTKITQNNGASVVLDVSKLAAGTYNIKTKSNNAKLIKQ